jgi:GR25 family glycosyltransferase involved in LPS biosynthesis
MKVLVINVQERADRRSSISSHLKTLNFSYQIVNAVDKHELSFATSNFLSVDVERILRSHLKCLRIAANLRDEYVLVLEDDAILNFDSNELREIVDYIAEKKIVFLQLGFLHLNVFDSLSIFLRNTYDLLIKVDFLGKFFSQLGFKEIERASKQKWRRGLSTKFVLNDVRYGAHCYLIHSSFAHDLTLVSEPYFLSADDLYVSLGRMKSFRMARLRRSRASQSKSPSSVRTRFVQE